MTLTQIAALLGDDRTLASKAVRRLRDKGLVVSDPGGSWKRKHWVHPSAQDWKDGRGHHPNSIGGPRGAAIVADVDWWRPCLLSQMMPFPKPSACYDSKHRDSARPEET